MKTTLLALAIVTAIPATAFASQCQDDIAQIDAALAAPNDLTKEARNEIEDMRSQAVQLCGAGNEQEGLDVTAEVKSKLNLQ
jgi:peptidoglycan hydrolase CwlO-like protein